MSKAEKKKIPYLIYAIAVSSIISSVTLARYMVSINGADTAGAAAMIMSVEKLPFEVAIQPGESKQISFSVVNHGNDISSEVEQEYSIAVNSTNNLPLTFALQCSNEIGGGTVINEDIPTAGISWVGGILPAGSDSEHQYTLTATWSSEIADWELADEIDKLTIIVTSAQVID